MVRTAFLIVVLKGSLVCPAASFGFASNLNQTSLAPPSLLAISVGPGAQRHSVDVRLPLADSVSLACKSHMDRFSHWRRPP